MATNCVLAPTRRRPSVSPDLAAAYWLDCHGPAVAALPGLSVYYQQHLEHDRGDMWPALPGISNAISDAEQYDGFAELGWADEAGGDEFGQAAGEANLMNDEQNFFEMCILQAATRSKTFFDSLVDPIPNGDSPCLRLMICFRRTEGASEEDFRARVFDRVAAGLAGSDLVLKVRAFALADYLPEHWESPNVDHDVPISEQYQAVIELAVKHRLDLKRLYRSDEFAAAVEGLDSVARHVNAFPVKATYCYVFRGERTLVGHLGAHRARTITEIGSLHLWPEGVPA
jgi:hypothetical protein